MAFYAGDQQRQRGDVPAVLTGFAAAVVGAFGYALIAYLSKHQFEIVAVLMGVLVGWAAGWDRPASMAVPIASAILTVFGCAFGSFLALIFVAVGKLGYSLGWVTSHLNIVLHAYPHTVGGLGIFFWLIAGFVGFRITNSRMRHRVPVPAPVPDRANPAGPATTPPAQPGYGWSPQGQTPPPPAQAGYGWSPPQGQTPPPSAQPGYGWGPPHGQTPPPGYDGPGFAMPGNEPPPS